MLAKTDFQLRYQGSILGFVWALLKPLLLFLILNLVFSHLFAGDVPFYSLQLLMGILMWNFFAEGSMLGLTSLMSKSHILTKIAFPRIVVVFASVFQSLMTFVINLGILLIALLLMGVPVGWGQILIFLGYCFLVMLVVLAFSLMTAPLYLRFRDLNQIWEVFLTAGFYATPVIYPLSVMPSWLQPWLYLNPMTFLIEHAKGILFLGGVSRLDHHLIYLGVLICALLLGWFTFKKSQIRAIELL